MTEGQLCPPHWLWKDELQAISPGVSQGWSMPWKFCWQFTGQLNSQEVLQSKMDVWLAGVDVFQLKKREKCCKEDLNPVGIY